MSSTLNPLSLFRLLLARTRVEPTTLQLHTHRVVVILALAGEALGGAASSVAVAHSQSETLSTAIDGGLSVDGSFCFSLARSALPLAVAPVIWDSDRSDRGEELRVNRCCLTKRK